MTIVREASSKLIQTEGYSEGAIQMARCSRVKGPDIAGERGFREAHQLVAMDAGVLFQALGDADRNLGRKSVVPRIHGCAN
jgi:hypothetical protein